MSATTSRADSTKPNNSTFSGTCPAQLVVPPAVRVELSTGRERGHNAPDVSSIEWIRSVDDARALRERLQARRGLV